MSDPNRLAIGLNLPTWPLRGGTYATWPEIRQLARDVEALGVDTLWVPDHLQRRIPGRPPFGFHECWTILAAAAEATSRIGIGPFMSCSGFRNPALLAKMAVTLDAISGGRVVLGLGSGDPAHDESWRHFGFDAERPVGRHAEAVEIVARMLREPPVTFAGEFWRVEAAEIIPAGPRPAGPPVWVAGKGDRTLAIAARWGDAVNVNVPLASAADVEAIRTSVAAACASVGRDPVSLEVTGWARLSLLPDGSAASRPGWLGGTPDEVAATLRSFRAAGLSHVTIYVGDADDPSPLPALTSAALGGFAPFLEALRTG